MIGSLRSYNLDAAYEAVLRAARLRRPQREAFAKIHDIIKNLDDDLSRVPAERIHEVLIESGLVWSDPPPLPLLFNMATGVGKTRLMGAIIAYLSIANQTRNCLILAPRRAVLDKLERESMETADKYLFIDRSLVGDVHLCLRSSVESFRPGQNGLNVLILSPQSITGADRRASQPAEFRGYSLVEYLQGCDDLVVFVDEAHHVGNSRPAEESAWRAAIRSLQPKLLLGLTATPGQGNGVPIYSYPLAQCLTDGLYTKDVRLLVEQRRDEVSDDEWDRITLEFGLQRLERKREVLHEYRSAGRVFPEVTPVMLVCARDTEHAESVSRWLVETKGLPAEEVLTTHSERAKTEDDIQRLVAIDRPGSPVRVVVNVFELTEGWDVTNVYVIAPLRAMATFQGALQTMGRGLRLPAGRRVGEPILDTLDVLCFGRDALSDIIAAARTEFGTSGDRDQQSDLPLGVIESANAAAADTPPTHILEISAQYPVVIRIPVVEADPPRPNLGFDIMSAESLMGRTATEVELMTLRTAGTEEQVEYSYRSFIGAVTSRVMSGLGYLCDPDDAEGVEALVVRFMQGIGVDPKRNVSVSPYKVAALMKSEIDRRYREEQIVYRVGAGVNSIAIGSIRKRVPLNCTEPLSHVTVDEWGLLDGCIRSPAPETDADDTVVEAESVDAPL